MWYILISQPLDSLEFECFGISLKSHIFNMLVQGLSLSLCVCCRDSSSTRLRMSKPNFIATHVRILCSFLSRVILYTYFYSFKLLILIFNQKQWTNLQSSVEARHEINKLTDKFIYDLQKHSCEHSCMSKYGNL